MINSHLDLSFCVQGSVDFYSVGRASCQVDTAHHLHLAHYFEGRFRVRELEETSADLLRNLPENGRYLFMEMFETVKSRPDNFRRVLGCQSIRLCPLPMPSSQTNLWNGSWWRRLVGVTWKRFHTAPLRAACFSFLMHLSSSSTFLLWPVGQRTRVLRTLSWKWPKTWRRCRNLMHTFSHFEDQAKDAPNVFKSFSDHPTPVGRTPHKILQKSECWRQHFLRFPLSRCGRPQPGGEWCPKEFSMSPGILFARAGLKSYVLS